MNIFVRKNCLVANILGIFMASIPLYIDETMIPWASINNAH